jgi:phosphoribosylanthranilate isomerase
MIVQIYEIQTPADAEAVIDQGVNHVGSVILGKKDWKDETLLDTVRAVFRDFRKKQHDPTLYRC